MNIAITGGTGFIGSHLVQSLVRSGHNVKILTRDPGVKSSQSAQVSYFYGDLGVESSLSAFVDGIDILFHCAGEVNDVSKMEGLHIHGTQNLINVVAGRIKRWVQLSSTGVYGFPRAGTISESSPNKPDGIYEVTKAVSDNLVIGAAEGGAFEYSILRPSVVFGSNMPNQSLFSLLNMVEAQKFFFIGPRGASANYIHVENVVHALNLCAFSPEADCGVFNLSDYATWEDFIGLIAKYLGVKAPVTRIPELPVRLMVSVLKGIPGWPLRPSRIDALTTFVKFSNSRVRRELNYAPCISMENAIADLVHNYLDRKYESKT
ncbi:NAD(P)-dependent oxidoreductase [Polynucleobacter sp. 80A-SIGWE]|uniref:NAD-dependent epimerase/dehydratase family protein n=1 Tax=Polynucleobacter sp. 80A-SIGWE TaxID=2689100 RepID=UPI001C0DDE64|nr:NAD-dependent epimerase/dehydratase family protein [Polynucleobacter sp. 80A-SIGWE]MBU3589083.1 NAD-dependent epimerase/dehydratase family protein [Polynucleobacter sp. 80A-SIGWE]